MQPADHSQGERAFAVEDLGHSPPAAEDRLQIPARQALLFNSKRDGIDRIGQIDGVVGKLVGLDQSRQDIQPVSVRRATLCTPESAQHADRFLIVSFCPNGLQVRHDPPLLRQFYPSRGVCRSI
jgi:hypothetical protein